ncbi:MAG: NUDIX hydrolase [Lewinellaceae bacterium]|nr:NUDIX hydrolase [Lewinellaceae bacterium]
MKNPWKTLSNNVVYDNPWIQVTHREVVTPTGTDGIYGLVHFKNLAIGIVPLDEEENTWLVGQYRYTLGQYSWEIPEGGCLIGAESPLESARRELEEETGIRAGRWMRILDLHTSNSVTDEAGMAFLARDLSFGPSRPEETEELKVRKLPFREALEMVFRGEITDALSMVALMRVGYLLGESEV